MSQQHKIPDAVQWHEGMLLEPHHFQQNDFRTAQLLHYHTQHLCPYYWGVQKLRFDTVSLVGGLLRILELEAVMPDGLFVSVDATTAPPLEFDMKKNAADLGADPAFVYLVVNAYRVGDGNAVGDFARYMSVEGAAVVDENTGDNAVAIPRVTPKLSFFVGNYPPGHFVAIPLAQVFLQDNAYTLTPYVPPTLTVPPSSPLASLCIELLSMIRRKISFLVGQIHPSGGQVALTETRDTLRVFIAALPPLEVLVYSGRAHPQALFLALAALAGQISTLRLGMVPPVFDFYQHNDLLASFTRVRNHLVDILEKIQDGYLVMPFAKTDRLFTLKLRPELLDGEVLICGIKTPAGAVDRDMEDWVKDAVIVTDSYVKMAQDRRILGAKRTIIYGDEKLRLVPSKGITLFAVTYDPAFIRSDESLVLFNLSDSEGRRPVEVMLYIAREHELKNVA